MVGCNHNYIHQALHAWYTVTCILLTSYLGSMNMHMHSGVVKVLSDKRDTYSYYILLSFPSW